MNLGGVSADYVSQPFTNLPLSQKTSVAWNVPLEGAFFGTFNVNKAANKYAYINTASNLI